MTRVNKVPKSRHHRRLEHEAETGLSGAVAGAAVGALAGPPGVVAGAVIGGVVGVLAGVALENQSADDAVRNATLDEEIGVSGGEMGAPNLEHPPATRGTYSAATSGTDGSSDAPAEGPMQSPDS
jgi:hypothetical protein